MVVLDASVILQWLVVEEGSAKALHFHDAHVAGTEQIIVSFLLLYEIANALRYRKQLPDNEVATLFEILEHLEIPVFQQSFPEIEEAALYARQKNISVYDAVYVVLARRLGCDFITADKRLTISVAEPFVKILDEI